MVSEDVKQQLKKEEADLFRVQELGENRGGGPGLLVPNSPDGLCERKATIEKEKKADLFRVQELCER